MMTVRGILSQYDLPRKFLVRFALYCANDVRHLMEDPRSLEALEIVDKWLDDKATEQEIKDVAIDPIRNRDYSVYWTFRLISNYRYGHLPSVDSSNHPSYVISSAYWATQVSYKDYAPKLLEMIEELTPLEQMLYKK